MICITIPTRQRLSKLKACLDSITRLNYDPDLLRVHLLATSKTDVKGITSSKLIRISINPNLRTVEAQNYMIGGARPEYHVLPLADDVLLHIDCLTQAEAALNKCFPDGDGVVGICVENVESAPNTAFTLVGNKYRERFPSGDIYCPEYIHFGADTEFGEAAKRLGRFIYCANARLIHHHPIAGYPKDDTHMFTRQNIEHDLDLLDERSFKHYKWGYV